MAVSAARSKMPPRPSAVAFCEAVLKIFSKTRGTASTKVGLNSVEVGQQVLDVGAVPEPDPGLDRADLDDPREHVGQGQEQQGRGVVGLEQLVQLGHGDAELEHEVAVGEQAALGAAGGAGGVDDRGQVERRRRRTPDLEVVVGDVLAEPAQHLDRVVLQRPDVVQRRSSVERRSAIRAVWAGPSATTAVAPESPRIHSICSADEVS